MEVHRVSHADFVHCWIGTCRHIPDDGVASRAIGHLDEVGQLAVIEVPVDGIPRPVGKLGPQVEHAPVPAVDEDLEEAHLGHGWHGGVRVGALATGSATAGSAAGAGTTTGHTTPAGTACRRGGHGAPRSAATVNSRSGGGTLRTARGNRRQRQEKHVCRRSCPHETRFSRSRPRLSTSGIALVWYLAAGATGAMVAFTATSQDTSSELES